MNGRPWCRDCVGEAQGYMVLDSVWRAAGLAERDGWVCLDCLEARLAGSWRLATSPTAPSTGPMRPGG